MRTYKMSHSELYKSFPNFPKGSFPPNTFHIIKMMINEHIMCKIEFQWVNENCHEG